MKTKTRPEDFRVEELSARRCDGGPFALYRLTKTSLGTPEAIGAICERWRIDRSALDVGGLKDRHAVTRQFVSIHNGPRRNLRQSAFELEYLGQTSRPFDSKDIEANRFEILLRDVDAGDFGRIEPVLQRLTSDGLPNYFDDQRFGSVGASGDFIARAWCLGDYERALWLAVAEPNSHDRPGVRDEKEMLRAHWGDWSGCRPACKRDVTRGVFEHLRNQPRDFRRAFARIPQHERRLYLGAFQSCLWNRVLAERLRALFPSADLFDLPIAGAMVPFFDRAATAEQAAELERPLPLPTAREKVPPGPLGAIYERTAKEFGLEHRQLRVKYPRDSFFSRGDRAAVFRPRVFSWSHDAASGALSLRFELPRGSYATILLKRATGSAGSAIDFPTAD